MNDLSAFLEYITAGVGALLLVYLAARLITAAYFQSKLHYERQNHGG